MLPMLLRHSTRLLFALLCVLLLTRLPPIGFAEEASSLSVKIEAVTLAIDATPCAVEISAVTLTIAGPLEVLPVAVDVNPSPAKREILRL